jgi:hypothetical protein
MDTAVIAGISAGAAGIIILGLAAIFGKKSENYQPVEVLERFGSQGSYGRSFGNGIKKNQKTKRSKSGKGTKKH